MDERTISRNPDARLCPWIASETEGRSHTVDFGCGTGTYMGCCRSSRVTGIELFGPYVEEARDEGHDVVHGDMLLFDQLLHSTEVDVAMFIDTIEHLEKGDGVELLKRCMKFFHKIIVFAPHGDCPQEECDNNPAQKHLSSWWPEDLEGLGFRTRVARGYHRDENGNMRHAIFSRWQRK